jgi:hypothetical protein
VDESALTVYVASCEKLEEFRYSVEERSAELEIKRNEDESPYDGDVMVKAADFLNLGAVPLNEWSVVMDVRPVREKNVCCALVQHKPKEGSLWWKICGGTGAHTHQGLIFVWTSPAVPSYVRRRRQAKYLLIPGWCSPGSWPHRGRPMRIALYQLSSGFNSSGRAVPQRGGGWPFSHISAVVTAMDQLIPSAKHASVS